MTAHPLLVRLLREAGVQEGEAPGETAWQALLARLSAELSAAERDRAADARRSESDLELERQRADESLAILRATLEATLEAIIVVDAQRRIVVANRRYVDLVKIPVEVLEAGDHHAVLRHAARRYPDPDAALAEMEAIHASDQAAHAEVHQQDGRIIHRYSAPVTLPGGAAVGRVTFFRDVTEERHAHAELEAARETAESANQAKTMFLANISHELRTPLNAVIGLADLLLLDGPDPVSERQRRYLEGIVQSGRHLLAMVNDVLDLAKIEAGKHALDLEHVPPAGAIEEAVALLQPLAQRRGVRLVAHVDPETPALRADPLRLRQILYNLISNAVKFTDRDGKVRISAAVDSRGVAIRVADTGIGIATDDMSRLFRPFEQLRLPGGGRPGGTGLGLALTKRLVDMHGGTIDVVSRLGAGTTFTVRLPVA